MTCLMLPSFIESLNIESDNPYIVVLTSDGVVVGFYFSFSDDLIMDRR